jgi:hypothetical protein
MAGGCVEFARAKQITNVYLHDPSGFADWFFAILGFVKQFTQEGEPESEKPFY